MPKRKHDDMIYFKPMGLEVGINTNIVSTVSFLQSTHPWNPEEPILWPARISYINGTYEIFYFKSESDRRTLSLIWPAN